VTGGETEGLADAPAPASADRPVVAAFDFDGTLTRGGSMWPFLAAVCGVRRTVLSGLAVFPRLVLAALAGGTAADRAKEALLRRTLGGRDRAEVARAAAAFGRRHYHRRRRPDVGARLEQHRLQGHRLVVVSASPELYVGPAGEELGADAVIATRLAVDDRGRFTGGYDGRNCRGEQKLARLGEWAALYAPGALVWAYGNSAGDRRLLAGADVGIDVGRLGPFGKLRAFRRLRDTAELIG
jgi:phosphatidylglycerophosphatase C